MTEAVASRGGWFERNPRKTVLVLVAASVLAIDLLVANVFAWRVGYAFWARADHQAEVTERSQQSFRVASGLFHHGLAPNQSIDAVLWGPMQYRVRTNSLGFIDREVREVPLAAERRRILFIGDSFTEGVGIDYERTFVGLIEAGLAERGIDVLNAGVVSYSPSIYLRKTSHLIEDVRLEFHELVVMIDLSDAMDDAEFYFVDGEGNVAASDQEYEPQEAQPGAAKRLKEWIRHSTILTYGTLNWINDRLLGTESYPLGLPRSRWTVDPDLYQKFGQRGLGRMERSMSDLHDLLRGHGIALVVGVYPWPDQILHGDRDSVQVRFWREWCQTRDVPFIDYFAHLVTGSTERERRRTIDDYYIAGDMHWNERGHRLIAEVFLSPYEARSAEHP